MSTKMPEPISSDQVRQRNSWQYRAIEATAGNTSRMGAIVIAVCGKSPKNPPRFVGTATIGKLGEVRCTFQSRNGDVTMGAVVCGHVDDLTNNFRGLADHLKLSDEDRTAMFNEVRKWCAKDFRILQAPLF